MLKFHNEKIVGEINIPINVSITEADIETIITSSFEGGSNHWLGLDNSKPEWEGKPKGEPLATWATKILLEGKKLYFYDIENKNEIWILDLKKLIEGIILNGKNRPSAIDKDNWDAIDADNIMQYALFKNLVFG